MFVLEIKQITDCYSYRIDFREDAVITGAFIDFAPFVNANMAFFHFLGLWHKNCLIWFVFEPLNRLFLCSIEVRSVWREKNT